MTSSLSCYARQIPLGGSVSGVLSGSLHSNVIKNNKYRVLTFLPKNLFHQFRKLSHFWYLVLSIVELLSGDKDEKSYVTVLFLVGMISLSMLSDGLEDFRRRQDDNVVDKQKVSVVRKPSADDKIKNRRISKGSSLGSSRSLGRVDSCSRKRSFHSAPSLLGKPRESSEPPVVLRDNGEVVEVEMEWRNLKPGDFVVLNTETSVPADVLILKCFDAQRMVFVDSSQLSGESRQEQKFALEETSHMSRADVVSLKGCVSLEEPNADPHHLKGSLHCDGQARPVMFDINNVALRGSVVHTTNSVLALVLFTGSETKIALNMRPARNKRSPFDAKLDAVILYIFGLILIVSLLNAVGAVSFLLNWGSFHKAQPSESMDRLGQIIKEFFRLIVDHSGMIPIYLHLLVDFVRLLQRVRMEVDKAMFCPSSAQGSLYVFTFRMQARTADLNEALGEVKFLFSDKTGTLTEKEMRVKLFSVNAEMCGSLPQLGDDGNAGELDTWPTCWGQLRSRYWASENGSEDLLSPASNEDKMSIFDSGCSSVKSSPSHLEEDQVKMVNEAMGEPVRRTRSKKKDEIDLNRLHSFFMSLLLCNSVLPDQVTRMGSPEEAAFLEIAKKFGYVLKERKGNKVLVQIYGVKKTFDVLAIHPFSTESQFMSVLVMEGEPLTGGLFHSTPITHRLGQKAQRATLYVRGSYPALQSKFSVNCFGSSLFKTTLEHNKVFSSLGLRTFVCAERVLTPRETAGVLRNIEGMKRSVLDGPAQVLRLMKYLECKLELLGIAGLENIVRKDAPETVTALRKAGIKIGILTGDDVEITVNVASQVQLIDPQTMYRVVFDARSPEKLLEQLVAAYHSIRTWPPKTPKSESGLSPDYFIVITGMALSALVHGHMDTSRNVSDSRDAFAKQVFLAILADSKGLLGCKLTPRHKGNLVSLVQEGFEGCPVTLAVGDGPDDVDMIQRAQVGVGIYSENERQAINASDYSIRNFRDIRTLLLVHGGHNLRRTALVVNYTIFKSVALELVRALYNAYSGFSQVAMIDWKMVVLYNFVFSFMPVLLLGVFNEDVSYFTMWSIPELYLEGCGGKCFNVRVLSRWVLGACAVSGLVLAHTSLFVSGSLVVDFQTLGIVGLGLLVCAVNSALLDSVGIWNWWIIGIFVLSVAGYLPFLLLFYLPGDLVASLPLFLLVAVLSWAEVMLLPMAFRIMQICWITPPRRLVQLVEHAQLRNVLPEMNGAAASSGVGIPGFAEAVGSKLSKENPYDCPALMSHRETSVVPPLQAPGLPRQREVKEKKHVDVGQKRLNSLNTCDSYESWLSANLSFITEEEKPLSLPAPIQDMLEDCSGADIFSSSEKIGIPLRKIEASLMTTKVLKPLRMALETCKEAFSKWRVGCIKPADVLDAIPLISQSYQQRKRDLKLSKSVMPDSQHAGHSKGIFYDKLSLKFLDPTLETNVTRDVLQSGLNIRRFLQLLNPLVMLSATFCFWAMEPSPITAVVLFINVAGWNIVLVLSSKKGFSTKKENYTLWLFGLMQLFRVQTEISTGLSNLLNAIFSCIVFLLLRVRFRRALLVSFISLVVELSRTVILCGIFGDHNLCSPDSIPTFCGSVLLWFLTNQYIYSSELSVRKECVAKGVFRMSSQRVDDLLASMFPPHVVKAVLDRFHRQAVIGLHYCKTEPIYQNIDMVSILFCDIANFDVIVGSLHATNLLRLLDKVFSTLDRLCEKAHAVKIETVGKTYMVSSGFSSATNEGSVEPDRASCEARKILLLAFAFLDTFQDMEFLCGKKSRKLQVGIGIHSGGVISGVVGSKKPQYALFGDTVNTASRMQSTGKVGEVHISAETYSLLDGHREGFNFAEHETFAKGKGLLTAYFVTRTVLKTSVQWSILKNAPVSSSWKSVVHLPGGGLGGSPVALFMSPSISDVGISPTLSGQKDWASLSDIMRINLNADMNKPSSEEDKLSASNCSFEEASAPSQSSLESVEKNELESDMLNFKMVQKLVCWTSLSFHAPSAEENAILEGYVDDEVQISLLEANFTLYFCNPTRNRILRSLVGFWIIMLMGTASAGRSMESGASVPLGIVSTVLGFFLVLFLLWMRRAQAAQSSQGKQKRGYPAVFSGFHSSNSRGEAPQNRRRCFFLSFGAYALVSYLSSLSAIRMEKYGQPRNAFLEIACISLNLSYNSLLLFKEVVPVLATLLAVFFARCIHLALSSGHFDWGVMMWTMLIYVLYLVTLLFTVYAREKMERINFIQLCQAQHSHEKARMLLDSLLPLDLQKDFRLGRMHIAYEYRAVTLLFADICGFTKFSSSVKAVEVVHMLSELFDAFDKATVQLGVYKVHTIGDAYVVVNEPKHCNRVKQTLSLEGLDSRDSSDEEDVRGAKSLSHSKGILQNRRPRKKSTTRFTSCPPKVSRDLHSSKGSKVLEEAVCPEDVHLMAKLDCLRVFFMGVRMLQEIEHCKTRVNSSELHMRVGIHFGNLSAGVMGKRALRLDIWGPDVLTGNKVESEGIPGEICASEEAMAVLIDSVKQLDRLGPFESIPEDNLASLTQASNWSQPYVSNASLYGWREMHLWDFSFEPRAEITINSLNRRLKVLHVKNALELDWKQLQVVPGTEVRISPSISPISALDLGPGEYRGTFLVDQKRGQIEKKRRCRSLSSVVPSNE